MRFPTPKTDKKNTNDLMNEIKTKKIFFVALTLLSLGRPSILAIENIIMLMTLNSQFCL